MTILTYFTEKALEKFTEKLLNIEKTERPF